MARSSTTFQKGHKPTSGMTGHKHSEESKKKISQSSKGRTPWCKGKKLSEEHKKKISKARKGKCYLSNEMRKKLSDIVRKQWADGKRKLPIKFTYKGRKHTEETKKKIGDRLKGKYIKEKHWNWKEDRSLLKRKDERNDSAYQEWVRKVKIRDNWECRINNQDCFGYCRAHHILPWSKYPELRYNVNNGITLCQAHHPKKRVDERRLMPFFQGMVKSKGLI